MRTPVPCWIQLPMAAALIAACGAGSDEGHRSNEEGAISIGEAGGVDTMALSLTTDAFTHQGQIPPRYTCDGDDVSPGIAWQGAPEGTASFALTCTDPDARGGFTHWIILNIPADSSGLGQGIRKDERLPDGTVQGLNDFRETGYGGPCPPVGPPHRYHFTLFALDTQLDQSAAESRSALESAIGGHVLDQAEIVGAYQRQR